MVYSTPTARSAGLRVPGLLDCTAEETDRTTGVVDGTGHLFEPTSGRGRSGYRGRGQPCTKRASVALLDQVFVHEGASELAGLTVSDRATWPSASRLSAWFHERAAI